MQRTQRKGKTMNRKQALKFVESIDDLNKIKTLLKEVIANDSPGWKANAQKLLSFIDKDFNAPIAFTIFAAKGNKKLPFYAFSSLALADCPGAGSCKSFCYSLKAWRYPAAFFRQLQNSLLLRNKPQVIKNAFYAIPQNKTLRLFVDGDFNSVETLHFFMELCKARKDLNVYGYSKSWSIFLGLDAIGYDWPSNYLTNASSGSKHAKTGLETAFLKLPIVRGAFDAVQVDKRFIASKAYQDKTRPLSKDYRASIAKILKQDGKRGFACPGNCGNCLPKGRHACGSKEFKDVTVAIGIH